MRDNLRATVQWLHMMLTASGFAIVFKELGNPAGGGFASITILCGLTTAVLFAFHLRDQYRNDD